MHTVRRQFAEDIILRTRLIRSPRDVGRHSRLDSSAGVGKPRAVGTASSEEAGAVEPAEAACARRTVARAARAPTCHALLARSEAEWAHATVQASRRSRCSGEPSW